MSVLRRKILGGVFFMVASAFAIDMVTGGPGGGATTPQSARGAPGLQATAPPAARLLPTDLQELISAVRAAGSNRRAFDPSLTTRDLFRPSERIEALLQPPAELRGRFDAPGAALATQPAAVVAPAEAWRRTHELSGIVHGRVALALIGETLYPRGAVVDGFRIIAIEREAVIFSDGATEITLTIGANALRPEP